jgi:hypothetical protein
MLSAFDAPDSHESCSRRNQTVSAPQALTMINAEESLEWAQALAGRVIERAPASVAKQVEEAYRLAYSRPPDSWEKDRMMTFLSRQRELLSDRHAKGEKLAAPAPGAGGLNPVDAAVLVDLCAALISSNEFVYRF